MKVFFTTVICLLLTTLFCGLTAPLYADAGEFSPITAEMQITGGTTFVAGEPVILHYKILSHTTDTASVYTGKNGIQQRTQWITWSLITKAGTITLPQPKLSDIGGLFTLGVSPSVDAPAEGDYVVNQRFDISQPGDYTLRVSVRLPYTLGKDTANGWGGGLEDSIDTVYTQDFTFPLTITPAADAQLQATAEKYRKAVTQEQNGQKKRAFVDALFSMPEKQAADSWSALVTNPATSQLAIDRLGRKPSARAAGILAGIAWDKTLPLGRNAQIAARSALDQMYGSAKPGVKAQIKTLYAQNGVAPPTVFYVLHNDN